MAVRAWLLTLAAVAGVVPGLVVHAHAQESGIREVTASDRRVIPLHTRLRYTTMIVLPDGEEILDVICGSGLLGHQCGAERGAREARQGRCRNEPEPRHREGTIYSFLLNEKGAGSGTAQAPPDLKYA